LDNTLSCGNGASHRLDEQLASAPRKQNKYYKGDFDYWYFYHQDNAVFLKEIPVIIHSIQTWLYLMRNV